MTRGATYLDLETEYSPMLLNFQAAAPGTLWTTVLAVDYRSWHRVRSPLVGFPEA